VHVERRITASGQGTTSVKATRFVGPEKIAYLDVSDPQAGPGEVVVRVEASALCAADLDPYHGRQHVGVGSRGHGPVIPGHEGAGTVESIAPDVRSVKVGDRVAVYTFVGCNNCRECRSGFWMLCRDAQCLGFDRDGPDAELLVVPARNCLKLPDRMDYVEGSLMTDLFGTTYTAARRIHVSARDTVAIFGMGPIGVCEVAICKALGAEVIGVDVVDDRLAAARGFGCDHTVNSGAEDPVSKSNRSDHRRRRRDEGYRLLR
jgi:propanol-preferring alcohol dehydrogenase